MTVAFGRGKRGTIDCTAFGQEQKAFAKDFVVVLAFAIR
jgi:hypothetical protein